jgi:hypothetical protein
MRRCRSSRLATAAVVAAVLVAGCGEREEVVSEPVPTSPSPRAASVIDAFSRTTGDELVAVERDPDAIGFPGGADSSQLAGSADLLTLDSEAGPVTTAPRYGSFVLNVGTGSEVLDAVAPSTGPSPVDERGDGIAWERIAAEGVDGEEIVTWVAHKSYGDVVLSWRSAERRTDDAFARLDRALAAALVGPKGDVGAEPPSRD